MPKSNNRRLVGCDGGRAQWCKRPVRQLKKDFTSLELQVKIQCNYKRRDITIYFQTQEDYNYYRLCGKYTERSLSFLGRILYRVGDDYGNQ